MPLEIFERSRFGYLPTPTSELSRTLKEHTIIFVPHARAQYRKWRFSTRQAIAVATVLSLLTLGSVISMVMLFQLDVDRDQLATLATENDELRRTNERFDASFRDLAIQVEDYQKRIQKLSIVAGLGSASEDTEAGIGGFDPLQDQSGIVPGLEDLHLELETLGLDMNRVEDKITEDQQRISRIPAIVPAKGLFTSAYGYRRDPFGGHRAFHRGIDIVAPHGKEIYATGDGTVIQAGRNRGLGKSVTISHGFGMQTRYGHLSKIEVEPGQEVRRGDVIGRMGNTGRSTGTHLHYEVHVDGKPVNPLAYIHDSFSP